MTASKTPNLQLMNPVGSDPFTTADFSDTFTKIDATPGILTVANAASRPTGWNGNQHGRHVWQADLNIMWVWNQPSGAGSGAWVRRGGYGWLGGASNAAQVNTSAISVGTAVTVCSASVMVPGGRPCLVMFSWVFIGNSYAKFATINIIANSSNILEARFNGNGFDVAYSSTYPYPPWSQTFAFIRQSSGSQESVNFQMKLRCQDPAVVGSAQGGGSCFVIGSKLDIIEV